MEIVKQLWTWFDLINDIVFFVTGNDVIMKSYRDF